MKISLYSKYMAILAGTFAVAACAKPLVETSSESQSGALQIGYLPDTPQAIAFFGDLERVLQYLELEHEEIAPALANGEKTRAQRSVRIDMVQEPGGGNYVLIWLVQDDADRWHVITTLTPRGDEQGTVRNITVDRQKARRCFGAIRRLLDEWPKDRSFEIPEIFAVADAAAYFVTIRDGGPTHRMVVHGSLVDDLENYQPSITKDDILQFLRDFKAASDLTIQTVDAEVEQKNN